MEILVRNEDLTVGFIYPHPDNPRKDLGDLTELIESIKENGILQNLTVIDGGKGLPDPDAYGYTCIIGHRRLAAAKEAGLKTVPCNVVEMDDREQVATMLLENMQRSDLTIYEQAQGFQMMIDLGETKESISKKTGLSSTTVSHRLELLKLDPELLKQAEVKQAKLTDYYELEKIKDPELKNKALKDIGTNNFNWSVRQAVSAEAAEAVRSEVREILQAKLPQVAFDTEGKDIIKAFYFYDTSKYETEEVNKEIENAGEGACWSENGGTLYIMGKRKTEPKEKEDDEWKIKQAKRDARIAKIGEVERAAKELRKVFVKKYGGRASDIGAIFKYLLEEGCCLEDVEMDEIGEILGIEPDENEEYDELVRGHAKYKIAFEKAPQIMMLAAAWSEAEDYRMPVHNWEGFYEKNERLEKWYGLLKRVGYVMSDDELALLDGTHECFEG